MFEIFPSQHPLSQVDHRYDHLTEPILSAVFEVANILGPGFLETVYHKALFRELKLRGLTVTTQSPYPVFYKDQQVGDYYADLVVENTVILELKCVDRFRDEHTAQCINYLKASGLHLCLLINFQKPRVEWRRIVHNL